MCAIIGIAGTAETTDAGALAVEGLHMLQHRGHEASGIATMDEKGPHAMGGLGLVATIFNQDVDVPTELPGRVAIGHNRYSTVGKDERNSHLIQPIAGWYRGAPFFLAHNGNITNCKELGELVDEKRRISSVDSELVVRLIEQGGGASFEEDLVAVLQKLDGGFAFLILYRNEIYAARDPRGNRPLEMGVRDEDGVIVFASETCDFETLGARWKASVEPGTIIHVKQDGRIATRSFASAPLRRCIFEEIYFKAPASQHNETTSEFTLRYGIGIEMERASPVPGADYVVPVRDSGEAFALGFAWSRKSGIYYPTIFRNHYIGRTFILPSQNERAVAVGRKHIGSVLDLAGKSIVLVDDSLVRGTTSSKLIERIRKMGVREVHFRVAMSRIEHVCYYGMDWPTRDELIAPDKSDEQIAAEIGADSIAFSELGMLKKAVGGNPNSWCDACVTGNHWHKAA